VNLRAALNVSRLAAQQATPNSSPRFEIDEQALQGFFRVERNSELFGEQVARTHPQSTYTHALCARKTIPMTALANSLDDGAERPAAAARDDHSGRSRLFQKPARASACRHMIADRFDSQAHLTL
jgi:hypothetical protein